MNYTKVIFLKLLFIFLFCFHCNAQHSIQLPNIDIVGFDDDGSFYFYQQTGTDSYKFIELYFEEDDEGFYQKVIDTEDDDLYTLQNIKDDHYETIFIDEIHPSTYDMWLQSDWYLSMEDSEGNQENTLRFRENGTVTYEEIEFIDQIHMSIPDKNAPASQLTDAYLLYTLIIDFGNGKQMVVLIDDIDAIFVAIPLFDRVKIFFEEASILGVLPTPKNTTHTDYLDLFEELSVDFIYKIKKDSREQYHVYDYFKKDLLQTSFDTIIHNDYYIVGKKDDEFSIYTILLQKIEIPDVKKVYLNNEELEILTSQGPAYYNHSGKISDSKFIKTIIPKIDVYNYEITHDLNRRYHHGVFITHEGMASKSTESKEFIFSDIKNKYQLSFLNNDTTSDYNKNVSKQSTYPKYLKIKNGEKYGIRSYTYSMVNSTSPAHTVSNTKTSQKQIVHRASETI